MTPKATTVPPYDGTDTRTLHVSEGLSDRLVLSVLGPKVTFVPVNSVFELLNIVELLLIVTFGMLKLLVLNEFAKNVVAVPDMMFRLHEFNVLILLNTDVWKFMGALPTDAMFDVISVFIRVEPATFSI